MRGKSWGMVAVVAVAACQDAAGPGRSISPSTDVTVAADVGISASVQRFAVVNAAGGLVTGNLVTGVNKLGPGQYEVTFSTNVSTCAYVVTTTNAYSQAIQSYAAGGHLSAQGVYVETKNQGGGLTDGPFNLIVTCGDTGIPYAVVGYTNNFVRGSPGVSVLVLGAGRYEVLFPNSVAACSFVASVNDPSNALVFSPSGVYTGSSANPNAVYIETKNPGGGLQPGVPFHLAPVCSGVVKSRYAVVQANGAFSRGNPTITTAHPSTGNYVISTNRLLTNCATVATRGSVTTAVPFAPATVEITPGPNAQSIGVQVRDLLFFGGLLSNRAFHAASLCL